MWQCSYCAKKYKYESEKIRHEQSHFPQFECNVCAKKFSFRSALRRHEKQHERNGVVQCSKCGGQFRDEALLKRHIQYAHKGTFTCEKCSAQFRSEAAMNNHMKIHQPESERKFRCSYSGCTKSFNFSHHLKHHMMAHTDDKQHFCPHCGKGFIQPHHLKAHMKTHRPDEWLPCTVPGCRKIFSNEYARKRHAATHRNNGASSDSSTTYKVTSEKELCACCGELVTNGHTLTHSHTCSMREQTEPEDLSVTSLGISINEISQNMDRDNTKNAHENIINKDHNKEVSMEEIPVASPVKNNDSYVTRCWARKNIENIGNKENNNNNKEAFMNEEIRVKSKVTDLSHSWTKVSLMEEELEHYSTEAPSNELLAAKVSPKSCKCKELLNNSMESEEGCFCEQVTRNDDFIGENDISNLQIIKLSDEFKTDDYLNGYQNNKCQGCECSSLCSVEDKAKESCKYDTVPQLEFNTDGVIKIKEMLDVDIARSNINPQTSCWARSFWAQEGLGDVPLRGAKKEVMQSKDDTNKLCDIKSQFNTCEDVLGKCIVSGTGNIEDECLCAKMSADSEQMIVREIEELTPCPKKNNWFNIKYKVRL